MDSLGDATFFSTLGYNSMYFQVEIAVEDREKTSFLSHSGLYRFVLVLFGFKNASATFLRVFGTILARVKFETTPVYLNDVIISPRTITEHIAHVKCDITGLALNRPRRR